MVLRAAGFALMAAVFTYGCVSGRITDTPRTAVEELLLSTACDRAVEQMDVSTLAGKKVFLDTATLEAYDKGYVVGTVADHLNTHGALLTDSKDEAEVVVALRSGALAIDRNDSLIGIPEGELPVPLAGTIRTPELAFFKKISQTGVSKLALHAYDLATGRHVLSVGPASATAFYNRWALLFMGWSTTDIPQKQLKLLVSEQPSIENAEVPEPVLEEKNTE